LVAIPCSGKLQTFEALQHRLALAPITTAEEAEEL
jgi:hypothetical protein